ncbi:hypothetical protein M0802_006496 [Mischocyttarus mexicanus]|nr:hypothetical protein M0802_006496 [Mischocyttarus mexicanus]
MTELFVVSDVKVARILSGHFEASYGPWLWGMRTSSCRERYEEGEEEEEEEEKEKAEAKDEKGTTHPLPPTYLPTNLPRPRPPQLYYSYYYYHYFLDTTTTITTTTTTTTTTTITVTISLIRGGKEDTTNGGGYS